MASSASSTDTTEPAPELAVNEEDYEEFEDDDEDVDEGARKKRICRSITPSAPSKLSLDIYGHIVENRIDIQREKNLVHFVAPRRKTPSHSTGLTSSVTGGVGVGSGQHRRLCLHVLNLKTKCHDFIFCSPSYFFERFSDGSPLTAVTQTSTILRDHANAVAFISKRSVSEQSSQQTTRFPIASIGVAEMSQQLTVKLVTGLCSQPEDNEEAANCSFIAECQVNHFATASPSTLHSFDFLASAVRLASNELEFGAISNIVPQTTTHIELACRRIVDSVSLNGARIWFSLALIEYLKKEPAVSALLREYGFTHYSAAVASSLLAYARAVVGNRARREYETLKELDILCTLPLLMPPKAETSDTTGGASSSSSSSSGTTKNNECLTAATLEQAALAQRVETVKQLSKKRKQSTATSQSQQQQFHNLLTMNTAPSKPAAKTPRRLKDSSTIEFTGAAGVRSLEFLQSVFASNQKSLLLHLISESTSTSESAARTILNWQLQNSDVAKDTTLQNTAEACARTSRIAVMRLLRQREFNSPRVLTDKKLVALKLGGGVPGTSSVSASTSSSHTDCSLIMACRRPSFCRGSIETMWVKATRRTKVGNVFEVLEHLKATSGDQDSQRAKARRDTKLNELCERALPIDLSGLSRSRLHFLVTIPSNGTVVEAIETITRKQLQGTTPTADGTTPQPIDDEVKEPHTTPSNALFVGMYLAETVRSGQCQIHSKQSIEAVPICVPENAKATVTSPRDRPWVIFQPLDIAFNRTNTTEIHAKEMAEGRSDTVEMSNVSVQLTMLGDSPVPLDVACDAVIDQFRLTGNSEMSFLRQARSLLFMGGVQAATLSDFSTSTSCKEINQQIAGTSKIVDADRHRRLFLTIRQVFVVGHTNVTPTFVGTAWEGTYGSFYDSGATASSGTNGATFISDGRRPAPVLMPDEQVNLFTEQIARGVIVRVSKSEYSIVPEEARSIPRSLVQGLHKALNPLCFAFESIRNLFEISAPTCMSLQALPISPFTEAVPCKVSKDVAAAHRTSFASPLDAQSDVLYRCDNTAQEYSILENKLFSSIRCRVTQPADNVFNSIESNAECVVLVLTMLVRVATTLMRTVDEYVDCTATDAMRHLRKTLDAFHSIDGVESEATATLCADACILLNICMPLSFDVGEPVLEPQYEWMHCEIAFSAILKCDITTFWNSVKRNWDNTAAFAVSLYETATNFNNKMESFQSMAELFETWTRGIWYVHSDDGVNPPKRGPFRGRASPLHVRPQDVNAVFVDNAQAVYENSRNQRGAAFGVQMLQLNQVLHAMNAATHVMGVRVQLYRNEGCLLVRPSSYALKRNPNNERPSAKSISPVQSENDSQAFGTREAKEACSARQAKAWKMNNEIIFAFSRHFSAPLDKEILKRGSSHTSEAVRQRLAQLRSEGRRARGEVCAEEEMRVCASAGRSL